MATKIKNPTKTQALDLAKKYLQTLGFNGFSFQTIADSLGIKKASLHYYFSSKEEMGLALLDDYEEGHKSWAAKVSELSAKEKLAKMVKGFCSLSIKHDMICPVGAFTSDFNSISPKLKNRLKEFHFLIRDWLVETIEQGKKEGSIKKSTDAVIAADLFLSTLQGGVQVARVRGDQEGLRIMLQAMLDQLHGK